MSIRPPNDAPPHGADPAALPAARTGPVARVLATALALMVLAVLLAWPVPILLAGAGWPSSAPGLALALWQSIALAGGVSMIGSLLVFGLIPFGATPITALAGLAGHVLAGTLPVGATLPGVMALCLALILGAHLLLNLGMTFLRAERQRRRHHTLIGLLSDPLPFDSEGTRVIDHAAPIAYCLPGGTRSATVLSRGLLRLLDTDQLRGVVAHERAHLRQQHHLVLLAFKSWHSALPWFPIANRAENAVALLVEMMADDQARLEVDDRTLARAIALVGTAHLAEVSGTQSPRAVAGALDETSSADLVGPRVSRLMGDMHTLGPVGRGAVLAVTAGLLVLPPVLLLTS